MFYLPLMNDNIDREDINSVIDFLSQDKIPKLTNGPKVVEFENAWGKWLGTKYNLFVIKHYLKFCSVLIKISESSESSSNEDSVVWCSTPSSSCKISLNVIK